jgi:hypothetical protein
MRRAFFNYWDRRLTGQFDVNGGRIPGYDGELCTWLSCYTNGLPLGRRLAVHFRLHLPRRGCGLQIRLVRRARSYTQPRQSKSRCQFYRRYLL